MDLNNRPEMEDEIEDEDEDMEYAEVEVVVSCNRFRQKLECKRAGVCAVFKFNEGKFDICDDLVIEDMMDAENGDLAFMGEDN